MHTATVFCSLWQTVAWGSWWNPWCGITSPTSSCLLVSFCVCQNVSVTVRVFLCGGPVCLCVCVFLYVHLCINVCGGACVLRVVGGCVCVWVWWVWMCVREGESWWYPWCGIMSVVCVVCMCSSIHVCCVWGCINGCVWERERESCGVALCQLCVCVVCVYLSMHVCGCAWMGVVDREGERKVMAPMV